MMNIRMIRKYFKNLHSNRQKNLEERDKFLYTYDLSKLNQGNTNHLNRSITSNEIEAVIVPNKENPRNKEIHH
jgi:hypothetical protein